MRHMESMAGPDAPPPHARDQGYRTSDVSLTITPRWSSSRQEHRVVEGKRRS
jgi:hypothetical protein